MGVAMSEPTCPKCGGDGRIVVFLSSRTTAEWPCDCPMGKADEAMARPLDDILKERHARLRPELRAAAAASWAQHEAAYRDLAD